MKKNIKFIVIIFLIAFIIPACKTIDDKNNTPHTLLWSIERYDKKLYLLGSVHIATEDVYPLDKQIIQAFEESEVLGVEINPKNINMLDMLTIFIDPFRDNSKLLSKDTYKKIKEFFSILGLENEFINKLKPAGIALLAEISKLSKLTKNLTGLDKLDTDILNAMAPGIDQYFLNLADSTNKEIYELESVKRQLKVFEALEDVIEDYIINALNYDDDKETVELQTIITAWKEGDIKTLKKILDTDYTTNEKLNKRIKEELVYKRNKEMAANIEKLLFSENKQYFIIVGAGHLVSDNNIIDILEKTGKYKIKRY